MEIREQGLYTNTQYDSNLHNLISPKSSQTTTTIYRYFEHTNTMIFDALGTSVEEYTQNNFNKNIV